MTRRSMHIAVFIVWIALFFLLGIGAWGFQAGHLMLIGYLMASLVLYIFYAFTARCPRCRMPMMLRPCKLLGVELYTWSLLPPPQCRHCGEPLE